MATDQEQIARAARDYFGGWYDALHLIRTGEGRKGASALWLPR